MNDKKFNPKKPIRLKENLSYLRKRDKKTLLDMGDILQLKSKSTYKSYEDGNAFPPILTLIKITEIFNVSLNDLLFTDIKQDNYKTILKINKAK